MVQDKSNIIQIQARVSKFRKDRQTQKRGEWTLRLANIGTEVLSGAPQAVVVGRFAQIFVITYQTL